MKLSDVKTGVALLFSKSLSLEDVPENVSFLDLGGDSLSIMTLIAEAEEKFNVELDPRKILINSTVDGISKAIISSEKNISGEELQKKDLYKDSILDGNIYPESEYSLRPSEIKNIFLTGATGFLGAFLIKDLLTKLPDATLFCHVRCSDRFDGLERIKLNMSHYKCWDNRFRKRITVIPGNLKDPKLGIDENLWKDLCEKIDAVYHNGAALNFLYPYELLKKTNVDSTVEALKLACEKKAKYFNFVSSYSVYDNPEHFGKMVFEDDNLVSPEGYFLGYSETKWVCEKLVKQAQTRGLRTKIYRPGDITGTKKDGIWEARDFTSRMIIGCIQMKMVPIVNLPMNFTPVDYVSAAIVHISLKDGSYGRAYNIINPNTGSPAELLKAFAVCKKVVLPIPYFIWKKILSKTGMGSNALKILDCMFRDNGGGDGDIVLRHTKLNPFYRTANTSNALADSSITCPPVDSELLKSYINYFEKSNLI